MTPTKRASRPAPRMAAAAKRPPLPPMLPNRKVRSRLLRSDRPTGRSQRSRRCAATGPARPGHRGAVGAGHDHLCARRRRRSASFHRARRRRERGARLAIAAHGVQERLHAGDVAGAAAVAVAFEHGVRVVGEQIVEEVLDERVRAAAVGAEQQREDVAGGGGRRARRAGSRRRRPSARNAAPAPPRRARSSRAAAARRRWRRRDRGSPS